MTETTKAFRVTGRVQGVGFRAWTRDRAVGLGLHGWVRNEAGGAVTGVMAGPAAAVAGMVEALHDGPRFARVDRVEMAEHMGDPGTGFEIRR